MGNTPAFDPTQPYQRVAAPGVVPPPPSGYTLDTPQARQLKPVTDPELLKQLNAPAPAFDPSKPYTRVRGPWEDYQPKAPATAPAAPAWPWNDYQAAPPAWKDAPVVNAPATGAQPAWASAPVVGATPPAPAAPDEPSPLQDAVAGPSAIQKMLNGPIRGLTNMAGFPGDVAAQLTAPASPEAQEGEFQHSLSNAILGDTPLARAISGGVDAVEQAPVRAIHAAGEFMGSKNLRKPFQEMGVIPEDGYQGNPVDTVNEYLYGALAPEAGAGSLAKVLGAEAPKISTTLFGALPKSGVAAVGAGAGAAGAREAAPASPLAEVLAATAGAVGTHAVSGTGTLAQRIWQSMREYTGPYSEAGQQKAAAGRLVKAGVTDEATARAINDAKAVNDTAPGGYKATTGTLIGEPGAIALEKASVGDPKFSQRIQDNNRAVGSNLTEATAPEVGATGTDTKQFLNDQHAQMLATHDQRIAALEAQKNEAVAKLEQSQGGVAALQNTKQQASEDLAATLETQKKADTAVKSGKYEAASEAGASTPVDPTPFSEAATAIRTNIGKLAQPTPEMANILGDLERLTPKPDDIAPVPGVKGANGEPVMQPAPTESITVKDLIDMRPRLSRAIQSAVQNSRGDISKPLQQIYDQFGKKLDDLAAAGDPGATQWRDAEANFKSDFAPKYRAGVGKQLDQAERSKTPVPPTAVAGKLLKPNSAVGAQEAADQLTRIFQDAKGQGTAGQAAAQKSARQYLLGQMGDVVSGGKIEAGRVEKFMKDYSIAIDRVPGSRVEIQQMLNRLRAGEKVTGQLETDLKGAQTAKGETEDELNASAASYYLTKDPEEAVNAVLNGEAKATNMKQLIAAAAKDTTGKASKGLVNTVKAVLNRRLRNAGSADLTTGGSIDQGNVSDWPASLAKAKAMLDKGTPERAALEAVLSPQDMAALDKTRQQLDLTARRSMKSTAGSDTSENESAKANMDVGSILAIGQNRGAGGKWNAIRQIIERRLGKENPEIAINKLLVNAMLDPETARTLALRYTPDTEKIVERRLTMILDGMGNNSQGLAPVPESGGLIANIGKNAIPGTERANQSSPNARTPQ